MKNHPYTLLLEKVPAGRPFMMVNYPGVFIRIIGDVDWDIIIRERSSFNNDGVHMPIVELATGRLSYMSKDKPCMVYPGEHQRF